MAITPLMPVYPRSEVRPVRGEGPYLIGEDAGFVTGQTLNVDGGLYMH